MWLRSVYFSNPLRPSGESLDGGSDGVGALYSGLALVGVARPMTHFPPSNQRGLAR
jgi:hypothetical protein